MDGWWMGGWIVDRWIYEWADGWMEDGWQVDGWMNVSAWMEDGWWMDGWMNQWMVDGRNDEWVDGFMEDGWWMDGWVDRWMDESISFCSLLSTLQGTHPSTKKASWFSHGQEKASMKVKVFSANPQLSPDQEGWKASGTQSGLTGHFF